MTRAAHPSHRRRGTEEVRRQDDAVIVDPAPVTNGNGSGPAQTPAFPEQPARRRGAKLSTNIRLAALCLVILVFGATAGYVGVLLLPTKYAARAEIHYTLSQAIPNELLREDRTLTTQLVLLHSRVVLGPVASANRMSPEALAKAVSAEVVEGSEVIQVDVIDRTRERAQILLAGVIDRYLSVANTDRQDPVHSYLERQLSDVQKQLGEPDVSAQDAAGLAEREQVLRGLLDQLQPSTPSDSGSAGPARLLTPPYQVAGQVGPTPFLGAATGATAAAVVAAFVILLAARRRLR